MKKSTTQAELKKINATLTALEAALKEVPASELAAFLAPLRQRKAELENQQTPTPPAQATLTGSGAIAQGAGATALGEGAVQVTGNV